MLNPNQTKITNHSHLPVV